MQEGGVLEKGRYKVAVCQSFPLLLVDPRAGPSSFLLRDPGKMGRFEVFWNRVMACRSGKDGVRDGGIALFGDVGGLSVRKAMLPATTRVLGGVVSISHDRL